MSTETTEGKDKAAEAGPPGGDEPGRPKLARLATQHAVRRQRRVWSRRVTSWDQHGSIGLAKVTAAVITAAGVARTDQAVGARSRPQVRAVDLGCGNGQLSLPLAVAGAEVLAVDVSPGMIAQLQAEGQRRGVPNLDVVAMPIEDLRLPAKSVDLVVSSYALHHLRDADKGRLVAAAYTWLRPGGRLIVADMMFGRGGSDRDRVIIRSKVMAFARKGPGGWWRIAKNAARYLIRVQERPVSMDAWTDMFTRSGFAEVTASGIVAEAGLVTGRRPENS